MPVSLAQIPTTVGAIATESGFEPYEYACGTEYFCNKGIQWAVFAEQKTVFINTHMQARDDILR